MSFLKKLFGKHTKKETIAHHPQLVEKESLYPKLPKENNKHIIGLIQAHKSITYFNYDFVVEWAIELIRSGNETPNILMLASFGPPIYALEIRPYIIAVLKDLGLEETQGDEAVLAAIRYYTTEILSGHSTRKNLRTLFDLCNQNDYGFELMPFYLLYYAWDDLTGGYYNSYYNGATLDNIEAILKKEAENWLAKHHE